MKTLSRVRKDINVCVLGSSSTGNCTAIWDDRYAMLVDCGLPAKRTVAALEGLGLSPERISLCLISHAHGDHVNNAMFNLFLREGIPVLVARSSLYEMMGKYNALTDLRAAGLLIPFLNEQLEEELSWRWYRIRPFLVKHDAPGGCFGYRIRQADTIVTVATDFGVPQPKTLSNFRWSSCAVVECNFDPEMLRASPRDDELKQRIGRTHCSNRAIGEAMAEVARWSEGRLRHVILTHISPQCNTYGRAKAVVSSILRRRFVGRRGNDVRVHTAYKDEPSAVVTVAAHRKEA